MHYVISTIHKSRLIGYRIHSKANMSQSMRNEGQRNGYARRMRNVCTARIKRNVPGCDAIGHTSCVALELSLEPVAWSENHTENDRRRYPYVARSGNARARVGLADRIATVLIGLS